MADSEFVTIFLFQTVDLANGGGQITIDQDRKDATKKFKRLDVSIKKCLLAFTGVKPNEMLP